jgi:hypothetical protein
LSDFFALNVTFYAPPATSALPFTAAVDGHVFGSAGGVTITFNPASQQFTSGDGSVFDLNLNVNPIQISTTNPSATVSATIVSMPEGPNVPMLGMTGTVLLGAITMKVKRVIS